MFKIYHDLREKSTIDSVPLWYKYYVISYKQNMALYSRYWKPSSTLLCMLEVLRKPFFRMISNLTNQFLFDHLLLCNQVIFCISMKQCYEYRYKSSMSRPQYYLETCFSTSFVYFCRFM